MKRIKEKRRDTHKIAKDSFQKMQKPKQRKYGQDRYLNLNKRINMSHRETVKYKESYVEKQKIHASKEHIFLQNFSGSANHSCHNKKKRYIGKCNEIRKRVKILWEKTLMLKQFRMIDTQQLK